jgi:hypothetical protein
LHLLANRALELIGKELGMFFDRNQDVPWDGDWASLSDAQLKNMLAGFGPASSMFGGRWTSTTTIALAHCHACRLPHGPVRA